MLSLGRSGSPAHRQSWHGFPAILACPSCSLAGDAPFLPLHRIFICSSRSSLGAPSSPIQLVEGTCLITKTLVSLSSLCLSIGPLGTCFIHRLSPAGLHMLADLHRACRLHGWRGYQLGHHLAASTKAVALKCRKLLPGDMWPRPGTQQTATAEEVVLLAPVGGGQSDAKHPAVHMAAPNTGAPSM